MFGSEILEVAIGIIFIFLLVSILCSAAREAIEAWFKTRAGYLERGIRELLHDTRVPPETARPDDPAALPAAPGLAQSLYEHPLISSLYSGRYVPSTWKDYRPASGRGLPSYIPARSFALALLDIAARGPATTAVSSHPSAPVVTLESVRANVLNLGSPQVQRVLLTALDSAQGDLSRAVAGIEEWYDSAMDRVSGWYRRKTQWFLFWIGLVVAVGMNINTITIADYLWRDDVARAALVARAEAAAADSTILRRGYAETREDLQALGLPIGWTHGWGAPRRGVEPGAYGVWNDVVAPILGWLLTALAATMGAPFWFDVLNKVIVIRSTVKPKEKSPDEDSEDRQRSRQGASGDRGALPLVDARTGTTTSATAQAPPRAPVAPVPPEQVPSPMDAESNVDECAADTGGEDVESEPGDDDDDEAPGEQRPDAEGRIL